MDQDLQNLRVIYATKLKEYEDGKMSPAQVNAYKKTLQMIDSSQTAEEWRKKMETQGGFFEMGRALTSDRYRTMALVMKDSIYPMLHDLYMELAENILAADDDEKINNLVEEKEKEIDELRERVNEQRSAFNYCVSTIFEYMACDGALEYEFRSEFERQMKIVGGIEEFKKMAKDPATTMSLPIKPQDYDDFIEIAPKIKKDQATPKLSDDVLQQMADIVATFEQPVPGVEEFNLEDLQHIRRILDECTEHENEIKQASIDIADIENQYKTTFFAAEAPLYEPGPYKFEKLIEYEAEDINENYNDIWAQYDKESQDEKEMNYRDKVAFLRRYTNII